MSPSQASSNRDSKSALLDLLRFAVETARPDVEIPEISLERPKQAQHGDFACNVALQLAKSLRANPRELAQAIVAALDKGSLLERAEVAGAGFINLTLTSPTRQLIVRQILSSGATYGRRESVGQRVMVEFVSANPTGLLHVGHGRGAVIGDAIASLLEWQGAEVHREFYYNDAGAQIGNLALSVQSRIRERHRPDSPFPEEGYRGDDIREVANRYALAHPHDPFGENLEDIRRYAVEQLRYEQDQDLAALGVRFNHYYLESSLYSDGRVDEVVARLVANGMTYEREGALWLKSTEFGDDKDRVMRKSDGTYTYFVPDVAYHVTKWERGFTRVINEQGSDHHGTIARVRAGLQALQLNIPRDFPDYVLHQMVTVMRGNQEVKLSKRTGTSVTVRELLDEVGRDAFRFLFLFRKHDSQLTFDIDLACSKSDENPVYYVQYAHARICSVLRQDTVDPAELPHADLDPLTSAYEVALLRRLADFPEVIAFAARELSPHLLPFYLKDLAADFHSYYNAEQFLVVDPTLRQARLALISAIGQVLRNGLSIIGVSAPEQM